MFVKFIIKRKFKKSTLRMLKVVHEFHAETKSVHSVRWDLCRATYQRCGDGYFRGDTGFAVINIFK